MRAPTLASLLVALAAFATGAVAHQLDGTPQGTVTACWFDTRVFDSLRLGPVTYCRGHLAYSPGALDCYQFTDQVCSVLLNSPTPTLTETRVPVAPYLFPCPDAPEPPLCPRLGWRGRWNRGN